MNKIPIERRLEDYAIPEALTGCYLWTKHIDGGGYGRVEYLNSCKLAHKVAYELRHGPVPAGLELDHLCRNRACINVDHLEAVTRKVNVHRGISFAAMNAKLAVCKYGHALTPDNVYVETSGSRRCKICRKERWHKDKIRLGDGHKPKHKRVSTSFDSVHLAQLNSVRRYVKQMSGADSYADAIRFLIRDWTAP